jgi:hypothetical protein
MANKNEARVITKNAATNSVLLPYFSDKNPAGIDIMPYAIKNENGNKPVRVRLNSKLCLTSTIMEFRIFVIKDITKNTSITNIIIE